MRPKIARRPLAFRATLLLITVMATSASGNTNSSPHLYETPAERRDVAGIVLKEGISVGGLIEVEASAGKEDGKTISDIVLATFELGVEAELNEWVQGRALLLWEEDETESVELDEAIIILGGNSEFPAYMKVGKMYVPFGMFNSHFISAPLTLEMAETAESAVLAGFVIDQLDISAGAFNGDADKDGDKANDAFAAITLNIHKVAQIGGYWISNIGESDTLEEMATDNIEDNESNEMEYCRVAGAGSFASMHIGRFVADAEYIAAIEDFTDGTLGQAKLRPAAWNIEAGIRFNLCEAEIALRYEGSNDIPRFPEKQYGIGSSLRLSQSATMAIEYLHGEFEDDTEDRNIVTAQLAMEF